MSRLLVLMSFFIISCAPLQWAPPKITWWDTPIKATVCMQVPEQFQLEVREALDMWNKAIGSWKMFVAVDGNNEQCNYTIKEVDVDMCPGTKTALACMNTLGGNTMYMRKGRYEKAVKWITLHEMAHALGAQHVAGTLMNPRYDKHGTDCPDIVTISQIAAFNGLNLETLSWCYY